MLASPNVVEDITQALETQQWNWRHHRGDGVTGVLEPPRWCRRHHTKWCRRHCMMLKSPMQKLRTRGATHDYTQWSCWWRPPGARSGNYSIHIIATVEILQMTRQVGLRQGTPTMHGARTAPYQQSAARRTAFRAKFKAPSTRDDRLPRGLSTRRIEHCIHKRGLPTLELRLACMARSRWYAHRPPARASDALDLPASHPIRWRT